MKPFKKYLLAAYLGLRNVLIMFLARGGNKRLPDKRTIESILAVRIDRMGDAVLSLPALKALSRLFPGARLSVLARKANCGIFSGLPYIHEVLPYTNFFAGIGALKKRKFDLAVDLLMDGRIKPALLVYLSKAEVRAGFDIDGKGKLFNIKFIPHAGKKQLYVQMLDLLKFIAKSFDLDESSVQTPPPEVTLKDEDKAFAQGFLEKNRIGACEIIFGIHPGGYFPSQRWQLGSFAELGKNLFSKYKAKIIIFGSIQEKKMLLRLSSLMGARPVLALGLETGKLAALIARTDVFICNNSGPLHLAAALGVPTVSTMGPSDPDLWWPAGEKNIVIRRVLDCSPCNRPNCKRHACLKSITVQEMERAINVQMRDNKKLDLIRVS